MARVDEIIDRAQRFEADEQWQDKLVAAVMAAAAAHSAKSRANLGECFAAAFDLIVGCHYYGNVAHRNWLYCKSPKPLLLYPYTNTCPRCALKDAFHFHKANKPRSGNIGSITSTYLILCYKWFFENQGRRSVEILRGAEPVDVIFLDRQKKVCLLAEIKASPLITFPLAVPTERLTEEIEGGAQPTASHQEVTIPQLTTAEISLLVFDAAQNYRLFPLGSKSQESDRHWAARSVMAHASSAAFFPTYFAAWQDAYQKYSEKIAKKGSFWLTNSCGQPNPAPTTWPRRQNATGYESVSDGKTSVGMDRTDDIKKGTYQVLKMGADLKYGNTGGWRVTTGLVSNMHAVQHYGDYFETIEDVIWTKDPENRVKTQKDLPTGTALFSLFDGIITFTKSHTRDEWLEKTFGF